MHRTAVLNFIGVDVFDFDGHFRRMERAGHEEFTAPKQELRDYLHGGSVDELGKRRVAWRQALARLQERSETELALMKELIGTPESV